MNGDKVQVCKLYFNCKISITIDLNLDISPPNLHRLNFSTQLFLVSSEPQQGVLISSPKEIQRPLASYDVHPMVMLLVLLVFWVR